MGRAYVNKARVPQFFDVEGPEPCANISSVEAEDRTRVVLANRQHMGRTILAILGILRCGTVTGGCPTNSGIREGRQGTSPHLSMVRACVYTKYTGSRVSPWAGGGVGAIFFLPEKIVGF